MQGIPKSVEPYQNLVGYPRKSSTILSTIKWCESRRGGSSIKRKAHKVALAATIYFIWQGRNKLIQEGKTFNPENIVAAIKVHKYRMLYAFLPPSESDRALTNVDSRSVL